MAIYPLYTVGYTGITAEIFRNAMHNFFESQGGNLIDTRYRAWSQNPDYRSGALRAALGANYIAMGERFGNVNYKSPELGIRLANPDASILIGLLREAPQIIMCGCKDHTTCHRTHVAQLVMDAMPDKAQIIHLTITDIVRWSDRTKPALQPGAVSSTLVTAEPPHQAPEKPVQQTLF